MKTYWDLSERERSELTQDDVQKYVDAELMVKGVLKVQPLQLEEEPAVTSPATTLFVVRTKEKKYSSRVDVLAFRDEESVAKFLALQPMALSLEYVGGSNVTTYAPVAEPEIARVAMFSVDELTMRRAEVERANSIREENARRSREHEIASSAVKEALRGLWDDWAACGRTALQMQQIVATWSEYVQTTKGDQYLAATFLQKVYPLSAIRDAEKWTGTTILTTENVEAA